MALDKIHNLHADGSLDLFLYREIGGDGTDGAQFASELQWVNEQMPEVSRIKLHINSYGGSVLEGLSIIGAMRASAIPVDTYLDGVAASIAGIIFLHGRKRHMVDYGKLMIHAPSIPNSDAMNHSPEQREALRQAQDIISKQLANNSTKSKEDFIAIMEKEMWIDPQLALSWGLIDEVVSTDREVGLVIHNSIKDIYNMVNEDHKPDLIIKTNPMKDVKNHLKLDEGANEESVLSAVKVIENNLEVAEAALVDNSTAITEKDTQIEALTARVSDLEAAEKLAADNEAIAFVENCIEVGKFDAKQKDSLIASAKNSLDSFKAIANSIKVSGHVDITASIVNKGEEVKDIAGGKSLRELEKANNPALLAKIKNETPEVYAALYKEQYGVDFK